MASEDTYCLCGQPYDPNQFMIQCDACKDWFHNSCVGLKEYLVGDIDKYHCPRCVHLFGPSVLKEQTNWHRHNISEDNASHKSVQSGTVMFIQELKSRHFPSADGIIINMKGEDLTVPYLIDNGFDRPIIIRNKEGLEIKIPDLSISDLPKYIDINRKVDVIDVTRQNDITMPFGDFLEYFHANIGKPLNLISLEISDTGLSDMVEAPRVAKELDWVNFVWPEDSEFVKPAVQKYCLIGMKDSYTDFHIDFGGTSVWYHIAMGQKIFYLIKPSQANLSLYQRWTTSATHTELFFGDQVDNCYKCIMSEGETMLIPTGWIHAVLTPIPSLVFGGNFLHSLNIPMQLQIYEMERKARTPNKFCFPHFEATHWYAADALLAEIKELNRQGVALPGHLLIGVKTLIVSLKQWNQDKDLMLRNRREKIPDGLDGSKLLKDLSKEIRNAERHLNILNPPKPERESKRKKRKPVNKDFVDFSQSKSGDEMVEMKEPLRLTIKNPIKSALLTKKGITTNRSPLKLKPLKLTLPKPVMYPYSINKVEHLSPTKVMKQDTPSISPILSENFDKTTRRPWSVADFQPQESTKTGSDLKLKIAKMRVEVKPESPNTDLQQFLLKQSPKLGQKIADKVNESIYDFHDGSEEEKVMSPLPTTPVYNRPGAQYKSMYEDEELSDSDSDPDRLVIKEPPVPMKRSKSLNQGSLLKMKLTNMQLNFTKISDKNLDEDSDTDEESPEIPKNGIEELLKASGYAIEQPQASPRMEDIESGRASPSTREAIAGMLSISGSFLSEANHSKSDYNHRQRRKRHQMIDDYGENMEKVHQDEDFIYPALDTSDDEELIFKPRGKRKMDEAWCPKARVGPLVPKTDRPTREGTKKQSVEKVLEAAAAKRAGLPSPKRPYIRRKVIKPLSTASPQQQSLSATVGLNQRKLDINKNRKPKKGMATVKQRLGKILKIHKLKF